MSDHLKAQVWRFLRLAVLTFIAQLPVGGNYGRSSLIAAAVATAEVLVRQWNKVEPVVVEPEHDAASTPGVDG